jgi:two-component system response regulator YesN
MYRAIIIDDEKWVIRSIIATIKDQEYFEVVDETYDGINGLELIKELKPDLAFVDVRMPGMGGLELLQAAETLNLNTLFIMISGHAEFAYAQKAMFHKAIGYCLKPFSRSELIDAMKKAFDIIEKNNQLEEKTIENENDLMKPPSIEVHNKMVQSMLEYINTHYCEDISIQNLVDICSINANYASQLFHQEVGETFSTYLTNLRIKQAIHLLKRTNMAVSLIADAVGYRDYFYFAKVFKKITGITPTTYRNNPQEYSESINI